MVRRRLLTHYYGLIHAYMRHVGPPLVHGACAQVTGDRGLEEATRPLGHWPRRARRRALIKWLGARDKAPESRGVLRMAFLIRLPSKFPCMANR